jgi:hypothetical protein
MTNPSSPRAWANRQRVAVAARNFRDKNSEAEPTEPIGKEDCTCICTCQEEAETHSKHFKEYDSE